MCSLGRQPKCLRIVGTVRTAMGPDLCWKRALRCEFSERTDGTQDESVKAALK
jgi:hypothetical protein